MITAPTLPPRQGYVEVDINGERVYRNIRTGEILGQESGTSVLDSLQDDSKMLKAQLQAQVDRSDFIEDCIAEMAVQVYGGV